MLYHMLATAATLTPEQDAVITDTEALSYQTLFAWSESIASQLQSQGISEAQVVLIMLPNSPEFIAVACALGKLGAICVPINTQYKEELKFYLSDSGATMVITLPELSPLCHRTIDQLQLSCTVITSLNSPQPPPLVISTIRPQDWPQAACFRQDAIYQYSTGSTGIPKRVVRSHENLYNEAQNVQKATGITAKDRILAVAPFFHAHGFGNCILSALNAGATLVILRAFDRRKKVINTLVDQQITVFPGVPFMFSILADAPSVSATQLVTLRLAFSAGAPLDKKTLDGFMEKFGAPIKQLYGSTETGVISINTGSIDGVLWQSVGMPVENVSVRIVDDNGKNLPPGQNGEIIIRSNAMTGGYANLPEENKKSFRDGEFWSGDIGNLDIQGRLFITGRKKLFINLAGIKVDPGEIEHILLQHNSIKEVVVLGIKSDSSTEIIKAVVVISQPCSEAEIRDWCRNKVADFKIPRIIEFREEIPKSPLGKVLRKHLQ